MNGIEINGKSVNVRLVKTPGEYTSPLPSKNGNKVSFNNLEKNISKEINSASSISRLPRTRPRQQQCDCYTCMNTYILFQILFPFGYYKIFFFIPYLCIHLFIYFWLCWVFVAARGLSLVVASGGYSLLWCVGFSLQWLLLLRSTGSRCVGFSSCSSWALESRLSSCGARA